jgi:hypothetical protein
MNPKFQVGDSVKEIGHPDNKAGEVVGYSFDDRGFFYKITSREVDLEKQKLLMASSIVMRMSLNS